MSTARSIAPMRCGRRCTSPERRRTWPGCGCRRCADCKSFLDAANYWSSPSENLICGDVDGNISWQASALTPSRKGWTGRLPVPGTGGYEWQGFRKDLPRELNPTRGFIATANHNVQPKGYAPPLMFKTAGVEFERITRLLQLIRPGQKYTLDDHARWQHDALLASGGGRPAEVPRLDLHGCSGRTSARGDRRVGRGLLARQPRGGPV